jgi:CheY-like chemotaxis protein
VSANDGRRATIVVVHEHAGVLELIEAALRERGARVIATLNSLEALEIGRRLRLDLLVTSHEHRDVARDLRTSQPRLRTLVLGNSPMWLSEIEEAVVTVLERGQGG